VKVFFDKFSTALTRCTIPPCHIYNMDETGMSTFLKPHETVAQKGKKHMKSAAPAERCEMIA